MVVKCSEIELDVWYEGKLLGVFLSDGKCFGGVVEFVEV